MQRCTDHSVLHSSFKVESSLTGAASVDDQHGVAQRGQRAQPQVLDPLVGVVH